MMLCEFPTSVSAPSGNQRSGRKRTHIATVSPKMLPQVASSDVVGVGCAMPHAAIAARFGIPITAETTV